MKTTFRFIIAAMAAIAVLSSCQKELANETANKTADGVRTISVQFDNSTKASLSGVTPTFANNDKIRVSNSTKSEECTITVSGTTTTFTTTLSGALTAIYPADAAVLSSDIDDDAPIASSNNFKVLASQDGTVEKAIIASATVAEGENTAIFNGLTALFEITPPDEVTTFTIKSLKPVVGGVARTGDAVAINTGGTTDAAKLVITVSNNDLTTFYVALKAGVNLSDLSFEYITDATNGLGAMKGIPTNDIKALASSSGKTFDQANATAANTKYTINNSNWHPYVTIDSKKWATMNVGATDTDLYGTYFAWGDIDGQTPENYTFSPGFLSAPAIGDPETLPLDKDAANANWGGSWRMPTMEEFLALGSGTPVTTPESGSQFGTSPNQIFLPAAGYGDDTEWIDWGGVSGAYWSSSLDAGDHDKASYLAFYDGDAYEIKYYRKSGNSVRALSE